MTETTKTPTNSNINNVAEKTIDEHFRDWIMEYLGYGYGTGEEFILPDLRKFFELCPDTSNYYHINLEEELTPTIVWLFIELLCRADIITYGVSTRYGWFTKNGKALRAYILSKSAEELYGIAVDRPENYFNCSPKICNCGKKGYTKGALKCVNPFWSENAPKYNV